MEKGRNHHQDRIANAFASSGANSSLVSKCEECQMENAIVSCTTCKAVFCLACMQKTHQMHRTLRRHKWRLLRHVHTSACLTRHRAVRVASISSEGNTDQLAYWLHTPCCDEENKIDCGKHKSLPPADAVASNTAINFPRVQHNGHVDYVHDGNLYHLDDDKNWVECGAILGDWLDKEPVEAMAPLLDCCIYDNDIENEQPERRLT